ncbi:hypothetical protein TVAG_062530 [Trichomonas vaginalis G3]|uniref:Anaphase-promoting complex subunit 10 n=1 Tax=Trichomonas vaginalis (strain ATCC PRA-98 / G3) TaxID=412133 RepID=A2DLL5_TRIV3|nr:anaphase-promoting complex-dependent catabolic process [Trichomonas vaginalis G3]EAY18648.1 hypothetical protein TVAG_062530 [Trichomonas vaginalis G3]KAI5522533.1 anaphase-promoting complex-dependent catabolic process [Trichomonas vaginalis G3]|eukprot:XP_001579634.1 hypothetical protein [Trichomonas vaginalis G3]
MKTNLHDITKKALWNVSTTKGGYEISAMFDGSNETFWQSDSVPPHYIIAQFSKKTYISKLSMYISIQNDETYTPVEVACYIGSDPNLMQQYSREELSILQGWVDIPLGISTIFLKIEITKNHQGGKDSRIRQIKLWGLPQSLTFDTSCFVTSNATQFLTIR